MVPVVQLVRASDCGSECRGFESHRAPCKSPESLCFQDFFRLYPYNTYNTYNTISVIFKNSF